MTPTPDDDAFVARLRGAYDQAPAHTQQPLPARTGRSRGPASARGRVALAGVVAAAVAAIPLTAAVLTDDGSSSGTVQPAGPPSPRPSPSPTAAATPEESAPPVRDLPPRCAATELVVEQGDDVRLPVGRVGRVVRFSTERDRTCRIGAAVTVRAAVGPGSNPTPPVLDEVSAPDRPSFVVAPGRDVVLMVSSASCTIDAAPGVTSRLAVSADRVGIQVADDLGATGSCGDLAIDWVVSEGFDDAGEPHELIGSVTRVTGFAIGSVSRVVATVRNPTDAPVTVVPCSLRLLPGQTLQVAPRSCDGPGTVLPAGGSTTQRLSQQFMGGPAFAGTTVAFTVDGVAAPVRLVEVEPRS